MKKPNITPGEWRAQSRSACDGSLVIKGDKSSDYDEIACLRPSKERSYGPQNDRDMANALAIAALPALLAALEKAYEQQCESVACQEGRMKRKRKMVWHSEKRLLDLLTERRDTYKAALEAAGYEFNDTDLQEANHE